MRYLYTLALVLLVGCQAGRNDLSLADLATEIDGPAPVIAGRTATLGVASATGSVSGVETPNIRSVGSTPVTATVLDELGVEYKSPKDITFGKMTLRKTLPPVIDPETGAEIVPATLLDLTVEDFTTSASAVIEAEATRLEVVRGIVAELSETERAAIEAWSAENVGNAFADLVITAITGL